MPDEPEACPECGGGLVRPPHDWPTWCRTCEWNLDAFAPPTRRKATGLDRFSHHIGYRLDKETLAELTAAPPPRPKVTVAKVFLAIVSLVLAACTVIGIIGGLMLMFGDHMYWARILGFFLLLLSLEIRPRWPQSEVEVGAVERTSAPELYRLVDEIADRIGAPHIHTIVLDSDWNASCRRSGLRRRPILTLGLPFWSALSPAARLALLGHELGHLVNGDPTQRLLTQPALTTFARLANVFDPRRRVPRGGQRILVFSWAGAMFSGFVFAPVWFVARWINFGLRMVAARDHQRAEIYADAVGLQLGGDAGAAELLDALLFDDELLTAVRRSSARGEDPEQWRVHAAEARTLAAKRRAIEVQHSLRIEASLFSSHPPTGMRIRLVDAWPAEPATDLLTPERSRRVDASLAEPYRRTRRALAHS